MLQIHDRLAGERIVFRYVESRSDLRDVARFVRTSTRLGIDTESTGIDCYRRGWKLRFVQVGNCSAAYVIPARYRSFIEWLAERDIQWIGHNGPHDWRSIDQHLGYETGGHCELETYLPAHHSDPRAVKDGGRGLGLKELAVAHIDRDAGKWEMRLKAAFKELTIPIPGEVYKSGPRKGTQKVRKAKHSEGWGLIPTTHPAYIAYAAADPILTYRVWEHFRDVARRNAELYMRDWRIQQACDVMQRRGFPVDIPYTMKLHDAYLDRAEQFMDEAHNLGCTNINSGVQVADALLLLGVTLKERTPSGSFKTDEKVLRGVAKAPDTPPEARKLVRAVLGAKQLLKRRESYTEAFLAGVDEDGRIHASINSLKARTARMSVSSPALQQLPTKDHEGDEKLTSEQMDEMLDNMA